MIVYLSFILCSDSSLSKRCFSPYIYERSWWIYSFFSDSNFYIWWQFDSWLLSILANEFMAFRWAWIKYETYSDCLREFFGFTVFSLDGLLKKESFSGIGITFRVFCSYFKEHSDVFLERIFLLVLLVYCRFLEDFIVASLMSSDRFKCWSPWFLRGKHSFNKSLGLSNLVSLEDFLCSGTFSLFFAEELMDLFKLFNAK